LYDGRSFVSQTTRDHLEEDQALVALKLAHGGQSGETRSTKPLLSERNCTVSRGTEHAKNTLVQLVA